ncbi:hypothetical protein SVAN01_10572 [Stagonosporopsis vannaccii]|nr:hypothetical protein SVAN01_10572 [Stagonosporopsis vannaccii]
MDICPAGITQVMSCDGTATSRRWCCGNSTDCCSTNSGVVTLKQVVDAASTSSVGPLPISSAKHSEIFTSKASIETNAVPTSSTATSTGDPNSSSVAEGVVAGAVTGAIVGLVVLLMILYIARRRSRRVAEEKAVDDPLLAEACGMSQRHELSLSPQKAAVQEWPGMPPGELLGDARCG